MKYKKYYAKNTTWVGRTITQNEPQYLAHKNCSLYNRKKILLKPCLYIVLSIPCTYVIKQPLSLESCINIVPTLFLK